MNIICILFIEKSDLSNPTYQTYPIDLTWNYRFVSIDTNPTKPIICVRLIDNSDLSVVRLTES